jgi:predicted ABC-type ATPase
MIAQEPLVVVIAGPNGAGKSTMAAQLLQGPLAVSDFVNADTIARGLSDFHPESVAVAAGRIMLARLRTLAEARADFAFETTLAGRTFAPWLQSLRASGYRAQLAFISLPAPELSIIRVADRVRRGGHHVPDDVIRRRFVRGLRNFFDVYQQAVDSWELFDNSSPTGPRLLASGDIGQPPRILDLEAWTALSEKRT